MSRHARLSSGSDIDIRQSAQSQSACGFEVAAAPVTCAIWSQDCRTQSASMQCSHAESDGPLHNATSSQQTNGETVKRPNCNLGCM